MSDRAILIFGMHLHPSEGASHYFSLYLIEDERIVLPLFADQAAAVKWAASNGVTVLDDWAVDDFIALSDVVAANTENGAFVVCVTIYCRGQPAPNDRQPRHRYWIFRKDGARIATRATLDEAFGWMGTPPVSNPSQDKEDPRSGFTPKPGG